LRELSMVWIPAHSPPQAKGRVERGFSTAQDRLVKGLRVAGASSLEQANAYLEQEFLPWWNQTLTVEPDNDCDAHRPLTQEHNLAAILSQVEERQISNGYTVPYGGQTYQIPPNQVRTGGNARFQTARGGTARWIDCHALQKRVPARGSL
jgi:hypothetical protein